MDELGAPAVGDAGRALEDGVVGGRDGRLVADAHEGLKKAASKVLSATWQRCRVHFMRNALAHVGAKQRQMVAAAIRTAFTQETPAAARKEWRAVADRLRARFPKLGELMDDAEDDVHPSRQSSLLA